MSSPAGVPHGYTYYPNPQLPAPPSNANNNTSDEEVTIKPMRLKVLYTFDDENKTNCLARGQDVLQVKTVALDGTTVIGVIDLKTCIQAVVQCSPEIIARLGQADYTVYAYDFSEYDTPLVGQGMLSRALATYSPTPDAPAQQSEKLITGRVCKNILGIFSNGVKETLEVKLRLVPVPNTMQSEYLNAMEKYREFSKSTSAGGSDSNEWTSLMADKVGQPNPSNQRGSTNMEVVNQLLNPNAQPHQHLQNYPQQQLQLFQQPQQQTPISQYAQITNADNSEGENRETTGNGKAKKSSRPSSRASAKRPRSKAPKNTAAGGNTSGYEECTDGDDVPVSKKRAKITQTDWNNKPSFGSTTDSLRVAASTAGSLRVFRPIAMNPVPGVGSHLQEVPRAPTPVPTLPKRHPGHGQIPFEAGTRRGSFLAEPPRQHISPYPPLQSATRQEDQVRYSVESAGPSPEGNMSPAETPPDIRSSPPVMRTCSRMRSSPPCPSSPVLPQMPRTDSGFMSGSMEETLIDDGEKAHPIEVEDLDTAAKYKRGRRPPRDTPHRGFVIEEVTPGPMELLPTKMPAFKPKAAPKPLKSRAGSVMSEDGQQSLPPIKSVSQPPSRRRTPSMPDPGLPKTQPQNGARVSVPDSQQATPQLPNPPQPSVQSGPPPPVRPISRPGSRMMVRTASVGSLTLPTVPASDPVLPASSLQRSHTWSEAQHPMTEAPMPTQMMETPAQAPTPAQVPNDSSNVPYSRTLNAKKAAIKQKLEQAIANGEMPPFCSNCGAIDTPTWRKAWSQDHTGVPAYYDYFSDEPGRVTAIVILERNSEGKPTLHQLIKKFLGPHESQSDWNEFLLCNSCGIWLSKYKSQRPEEKWENGRSRADRGAADKKGPERKRATQRQSRSKKSNGNIPTSEANFPPSEALAPPEHFHYQQAAYPTSDAFPQSEAYSAQPQFPGQCMSPPQTTGQMQQHDIQLHRAGLPAGAVRSSSVVPLKRPNVATSDAASQALKRAIQSSPAKWAGTQHSPIEIDELGSTRRLLFPSPRKDESPKVLGVAPTNVEITKEDNSTKDVAAGASNKENCPPASSAEDADAELLKLFEAEISRPTTPVQTTPAPNPFKTPTRPTPNHRPVTRSITRSGRSRQSQRQELDPLQRTPLKTPSSSARRRHLRSGWISPFTGTINDLLEEANSRTSPPRHCEIDIDYTNMPDMPFPDEFTQNGLGDSDFNLDSFFSDVPMQSSPPKLFHLYEDPASMGDVDWNQFNEFNSGPVEEGGSAKAVEVKTEPGPGEGVKEQMPRDERP